VTAKQRLQIALYSALTQTPAPDIDVMDYESAGAWAKARWLEYMAMDLEYRALSFRVRFQSYGATRAHCRTHLVILAVAACYAVEV
jgi:hypothetical protein